VERKSKGTVPPEKKGREKSPGERVSIRGSLPQGRGVRGIGKKKKSTTDKSGPDCEERVETRGRLTKTKKTVGGTS